jgi:extracellular elastinolytic metalloproteinase
MRSITTIVLSLCILAAYSIQDPQLNLIKKHINESVKSVDSEISFNITSKVPGTNGVEHFYGIQTYNGFPIFETNFNVTIVKGDVVNYHHNFLSNPESYVVNTSFSLSAGQAIQRIVADYPVDYSKITEIHAGEFDYNDLSLSDEVIKVYKKWYKNGTNLIPIYEVSLYEKDHSHWFNTRLDANTGEIINKNDWVVHCNLHGSSPVLKEAALPESNEADQTNKVNGTSSYRVFARPLESPNHGARTIEVDPDDADASPHGWHDVDGSSGAEYTITRGNNVYASEDKDANNVAGTSPDGGSSLSFNDTFNINQSAALFTDAAVTNLFYWNNIMHDVWWHYGFDEASGNFQSNNYGNGGIGGDFVRADAQDGSGTNNANFASPPDGNNPRMQMYIWSNSTGSDFFMVNSPAFASGKYGAKRANFGASLVAVAVTEDLILVDDGTGTTEDGCETITNTTALNGKIALIQRGGCPFVVKVKNAQNAGAVGAVVFNNQTNSVVAMGGTDATITIPSVFIEQNNGDYIKGLLSSQTVNVSLYDSSFLDPNTFDSDFDNGVIAHEYGHGISIRLSGGPAVSSCLSNQEQMGEGWSDFFALVMTHEPGDVGTAKRGIGTYVRNQGVNGNGIRPYPYSTNTGISPYSYDDIKTFSVPHGVGSVWCSMLWDLYWAMIDEYGYDSDVYTGTGGNNMAMQLVIDGLKLQPCNPGFEDGRDAILLADRLNNNGDNERLIWDVFRKRGLGYYADQGSTQDRGDGTEDYSWPPYLQDELIISKTAVLESENDEDLEYTLTAINSTLQTVFNVTIKDTLDKNVSLDEASIACDYSYDAVTSTLVFFLDSMQSKDTFSCGFVVIPQFDSSTKVISTEDFESGAGSWSSNVSVGSNVWTLSNTRANSGDFSWFAPETASISDYDVRSSFNITDSNAILGFTHWFETEAGWDGGVVEIRESGGSWEDAGPYFYMNGYNSTIGDHQFALISGRNTFSGSSNGFITSKLDLGKYAGTTIDVRFRFTTDSGTAGNGWYVDDVILETGNLVENKMNIAYDPSKKDMVSVKTYIFGDGMENNASIKTLKQQQVQIYPNPAHKELTIEFEDDLVYKATIIDANGRIVLQDQLKGISSIDISQWSTGLYIIKLETNHKVISGKFIKN